MKTSLYKSTVSTPYGIFTVIVDSTEYDARRDIMTAITSELPAHFGTIKINKVQKTNRRLLKNASGIKRCFLNEKYWAWISR